MLSRTLLLNTLVAAFVFTGCSLLSPYTITFTTANEAVVDPAVDTVDLVISQPAYAYISRVDCLGEAPYQPLPVIAQGEEAKMAYNLELDFLADVEAQTLCELEVTAFDESTTQSSRSSLRVYVLEAPVEEEEVPHTEEDTEEAIIETDETPQDEDVEEVRTEEETELDEDTEIDEDAEDSTDETNGETETVSTDNETDSTESNE